MPLGIGAAPTRTYVEEPAGETRLNPFAGINIFQLDETALPAAVAKRFPLLRGQLLQ